MPLIDSLSPRQRFLAATPDHSGDNKALKAAQHRQWLQEIQTWAGHEGASARLARHLTPVPILDDRLDTVTTDGRHLFFNARFTATLRPVERHFITAHLVWHCVCGHIVAQSHRDNLRWNLACEHEANYLVLLEGLRLPRDAVFYFSQAGRSNGQVYDWLAAHPHPQYDHHFDQHPLDPPRDYDEVTLVDPDYTPLDADDALANLWLELAQRERLATPLRAYLIKRQG
ncbi:DUF2201 family putative metallopeptidase [Halomonas sp. 328]|uniref:DUF2201 family putative metallopeptidase n=1 Tax=Halomonas sp. 328 TaxID=2776704 RepID=UPI0018A753F4|nr:hypothetical protein [Halomonas sp. 328]MBF8224388.1 hypothetical protein [Halomonas sp. 328]